MRHNYVVSIMICITFPNLVRSRNCNEPENSQPKPDLNRIKQFQVPELSTEPVGKPKNRCCPYDFDSRICKIVNDRVLCGYNRNVGYPLSNDHEISLGENCRLRGGRLECGYVNAPFTNIRRPPASYNPEPDFEPEVEEDNDIGGHGNYKDSSHEISQDNVPQDNVPQNNVQKLTISKPTPKAHDRGVTRCVEIRDRIVCRDM